MKKDVLVSIKGLLYTPDEENKDDQRIETLTRGTFYNKANKNFVTYEESLDGEEIIKSMLKFDEHSLELTKKGKYNVHMIFEEGKKNYTNYNTPFGDLLIGIDTEFIKYKEADDEINMIISYDMEMNYSHVARCEIDMKIQSVL